MANKYKFNWEDLNITVLDIAEGSGYPRDRVPERISSEIESIWLKYRSLIEPQVVVKILPAQIVNDELCCADANFAIGNNIAAQVAGLQEAAFFVCTIGERLEQESARLTDSGELMQGFIVDCIGSLAAERLAEILQQQIEHTVELTGKTISNRFSPGYCHWNVSAQHDLFRLLGSAPCGIVLSSSAMMRPLKSISGFIGIGVKLKKGYACQTCEQQDKCLFRNRKNNL
ncbi:MAG: vitamin B12 dependent-methionine synthase activation domain-containing protein [Bacillota bacterium]